METYKNDYTKEEDEVLWELHEIRHQIHEDNAQKTYAEINDEAFEILRKYKEKQLIK
ncbi:MAG: hypothetical protein HN368_04770 [Spirochaetales bacterium]|jgi:hypothetical protein|nr:hypothetical protein [Spirochaetales bacterium]